jgi:anti-sigma factor (TIGR02949 family)
MRDSQTPIGGALSLKNPKGHTVANPDLTCEEVLKHLMAYLDHEIDAEVAANIEHHLEACRGCFSRAEFERHLKEHVHAAGAQTAPASLRARIKQIVDKF